MAHLIELQDLTDQLVQVVTGTSVSTNPARFRRCRESALRGLRQHSFLRTNPFEVGSRLDGLEERLRISHRETLADAMRSRRDLFARTPLGSQQQHAPEVLHLLLELSDRPVSGTRLDHVLALIEDHDTDTTPRGPGLRWEAIAREDGWNEDEGRGADTWARPDFGDSSEDSETPATATPDVTDDDDDDGGGDPLFSAYPPGRTAEDFVVGHEDRDGLGRIQASQAWRTRKPTFQADAVVLSECQVLRDALFMLQGLRTSLFDRECAPVPTYRIEGLSREGSRALAGAYADAGRGLRVLRLFAARPQAAPHLQVFNDCIVRALADFDRLVSGLEARLVAPRTEVVVSLLATLEELRPGIEPLLALSSTVRRLQENQGPREMAVGTGTGTSTSTSAGPGPDGFRYLELLFSDIAEAQLTGQTAVYEFLARMFLHCFRIYVRPVRLWMEEGRLLPADKIFFVSEAATAVPPAQVWRSRFRLRQTTEGALHAPAFLHPSADRIFTAGKSLVVLRMLGRSDEARRAAARADRAEPGLDFDSVCGRNPADLTPFAELFAHAFDGWIQSKYWATSATLKGVILDRCGLTAAFDALEYLYFARDGSAADAFAAPLFAKLDRADPTWSSAHTLGSVAKEAYGAHLDPTRLSIAVGQAGQKMGPERARDSVRAGLPEIMPVYRLAWPIQMMIGPETISRYRAVFTFLLQLRRAAGALGGSSEQRRLLAYSVTWSSADSRQVWAEQHAAYYSLRCRLLWFCAMVQTYLVTLVLAPNCARLRQDVAGAADVDAIIGLHDAFTRRVAEEACLGPRLGLIHDSVLDILDLATLLQAAHSRVSALEVDEMRELSRLSAMSSPLRQKMTPTLTPTKRISMAGDSGDNTEDDDDDPDDNEEGGHGAVRRTLWGGKRSSAQRPGDAPAADRPFRDVLHKVEKDLERHLRFVTTGLRGVARATSDEVATKWNLLAETLETGAWGRTARRWGD